MINIYYARRPRITNSRLATRGVLAEDGKSLLLGPDIRLILDPEYYAQRSFGSLGNMPEDIEFCDVNPGLDWLVSESLGEEHFGNLTVMGPGDTIGRMEFSYTCSIRQGDRRYVLRYAKYKNDDLYALYLLSLDGQAQFIGLSDVVVQGRYDPRLAGIGIKNELQGQGHGTVLLSATERDRARSDGLLVVDKPLKQEIPFYVWRGYRYIVSGDETVLAKILNPLFDI